MRSIFHSQRACVHSARRGDSAIASIYAFTFQLAFRSHIAFRLHIAKVIDSHIVFDRSFVCSVIAGDSGGTLIGRSDSVLIGLNVTFIGFDLALEIDILRFEVSDIRCHFAIQRSDFPFQLVIFILACRLFSIDFPFQCYIRSIAILNFLVDLIIQCCIGYNAVSDLCVNLIIQRRIRRNAVSDLCVNLIIQRRIGCNAIIDLRVNSSRQFRIFRFQTNDIRLRCRHIGFQGANIGLRCRHTCLQHINIRFGSCHTSRKVIQGCLCVSGLGIQILNSLFICSNFRRISSDLTIQLILCCSNLSLKICLRRIQCSRSGKFTIRRCYRVDIV